MDEFIEYGNNLGIEVSKKWSRDKTNVLRSKPSFSTNEPLMSNFKVMSSILHGIPIVNDDFLIESYNLKKILDPKKFILNYRQIGAKIFDKYFIIP